MSRIGRFQTSVRFQTCRLVHRLIASDAWTLFAKFTQLDTTENHRQQFFSIFGNHVAGQGSFKVVSSNRKRKNFVGLRFKKSPHIESEPPPKRGNIKANEEEVKHLGINEETVTADYSYETIQEEAFTMPHNFLR